MKINLKFAISLVFSLQILLGYANHIPNYSGKKQAGLTLIEAEKYIAEIDAKEKSICKSNLELKWKAKAFKYKDKTMEFETNIYGEIPADGRSLYISMHGGGAASSSINDGQWKNQIIMTSDHSRYYGIKEGVVIIPRAPVDDWNMWFQPEIDYLFEDAIRAAVLFANVNPNKVYIMGYSAGGDGVFRLATRMADHWAAASMSAGHPGEVTPANLRNIGFALNMGRLDSPYNRNTLATEWKVKLENLHLVDPEGYRFMANIFHNKSHWMEMEDRVAIPFMAEFKRNPYPDKVVWEQNSFHVRSNFYWLGISEKDIKETGIADNPSKVIKVSYKGNTINIEDNYADELSLYLNDKMVNLDKKIIVNYKGKKIFKGKVKRQASVIQRTASQRKDSDYIFSAQLKIIKNKSVLLFENQ